MTLTAGALAAADAGIGVTVTAESYTRIDANGPLGSEVKYSLSK